MVVYNFYQKLLNDKIEIGFESPLYMHYSQDDGLVVTERTSELNSGTTKVVKSTIEIFCLADVARAVSDIEKIYNFYVRYGLTTFPESIEGDVTFQEFEGTLYASDAPTFINQSQEKQKLIFKTIFNIFKGE